MIAPYTILDRKRAGEALDTSEIQALIQGATDGTWSDAQLAAFLMAAAIRGLDSQETQDLTQAMLGSGVSWDLAADMPGVVDKHSTGGIGDKVSLILAPLLAACHIPVAMLTGRGLGHTGGTADKLESLPGMELELQRQRCLDLLRRTGMAVGVATASIAPADRRLYALRDATATVSSVPLVTGSILSKKLATGAAAIVFDVKVGNGAFFPELKEARQLARLLVETSTALGRPARALITDMSQPLGRWAGHAAEVNETLECLSGDGEERLMEVTYALCQEVSELVGSPLSRKDLEGAVASGSARQRFEKWAAAQGTKSDWRQTPQLPLAPVEVALTAPRSGVLARVHTRQLGLLLGEAGGARRSAASIDFGVALKDQVYLGQAVAAGDELCRLYLRRPDPSLVERFEKCFEVADTGEAPPLIHERIRP